MTHHDAPTADIRSHPLITGLPWSRRGRARPISSHHRVHFGGDALSGFQGRYRRRVSHTEVSLVKLFARIRVYQTGFTPDVSEILALHNHSFFCVDDRRAVESVEALFFF